MNRDRDIRLHLFVFAVRFGKERQRHGWTTRWTGESSRSGQGTETALICFFASSPNGVRTRVSTLRGWCPRPLDDGAGFTAPSDASGTGGSRTRFERWHGDDHARALGSAVDLEDLPGHPG